MNRTKAMAAMQYLLKNQFKYLYVSDKTHIYEQHLSFQMDSTRYELQSSMQFGERWVDILTFISPTAVKVDSEEYIEALRTVNFINWCSKSSSGRMYLDDVGDIAFSQRFTYEWLEKYPEIVIHEYEAAIQYYEDLFTLLIEIAEGKKNYTEARDFIEMIWNLY